MSESPSENTQSTERLDRGRSGRLRRPKDRHPPEHTLLGIVYLWIADVIFIGASGFVVALWVLYIEVPQLLTAWTYWAYIGFGALLAGLVADRVLRHKFRIYETRFEDASEVEALIVEARNVEPRLTDPEEKPDNYNDKLEHLMREVQRLVDIGPAQWVEYQVLPLRQKLVEFLKADELITRAQSTLAGLKEYAEDSASRVDGDYYSDWNKRIDEATKNVKEAADLATQRDSASEPLRGILRTLLGDVAEYGAYWADGKAKIFDMGICVAAAVPILLLMGLIPRLHPAGNGVLNFFNWGLLGTSGSLTAVLLLLYRSKQIDVGYTEGANMLRRSLLGASLGFVAGVLIYSIMSAGFVTRGLIVPDLSSSDANDIGLSVFLAFVSGFLLESIYDRLRSTFERNF